MSQYTSQQCTSIDVDVPNVVTWLDNYRFVFLTVGFISFLLPLELANGQPSLVSFGDTLYAKANASLRMSAQPSSGVMERLEFGDTLLVKGAKTVDGSSQWKVAIKGKTGWMGKSFMLSESQYLAHRKVGDHLRGSEQDTVVVKAQATYLWEEAARYSDTFDELQRGDRVELVDIQGKWARVEQDGREGFLPSNDALVLEKYRAEQRKRRRSEKRREQAEKRRERELQSLRDQGFTIKVNDQGFSQNSADGITHTITIVNISESKTVKYVWMTLRLFSPVGEPTSGDHSPATQTVRGVGPIEPGERGYYEFDNAWYSSTGSCVEIRKIEVQHIDGSRFTYVDDLKRIIREGRGISLAGDCSYEAQQGRQ